MEPLRLYIQAGDQCVIGSDPGSDLPITNDSRVRPRHARLVWNGARLRIEPIGDAPLTVNGAKAQGPTAVASGDWVTLGTTAILQLSLGADSVPAQTSRGVEREVTASRDAIEFRGAGMRVVTIGRLPDNNVHIPSPIVSRHHARIVPHATSGWAVEDLGSTNGTFVNGKRVVSPTMLRDGDRIQIGSFEYMFAAGSLTAVDRAGRIRLEARNLRKRVVDRTTGAPKDLVAGVNLAIEPGEFVGIFGTSGSGKSTLMDALCGRRPANDGAVFYNGVDLYRAFDLFKATIGYVPQQDIVHRRIMVRRALEYAARLRLPDDSSREEIDSNVERVLTRVGLSEKATLLIDTPAPLSGGQLKRVSLAVELVSNPAILFLDEATSGLDAGTDKRMMKLFAELAADGRTVACVTHTLENIDTCSLVIILFDGRVVYYGPPGAVSDYFRIDRVSEVYDALEQRGAEAWEMQYAASELHREYVVRRLNAPPPAGDTTSATVPDLSRTRSRWFDWSQCRVLTERYVDLVLADRRNLAVLLVQAPIIGGVIGMVFDTDGPLPLRAATEMQISLMLVVSAIWFGCLNAAREVVKELPVYLRERSVVLRIAPYLASKLFPLMVLCALQCLALLAVVMQLVSIPGTFSKRLVVLFLIGMAAQAMGLAVSAVSSTNDKAVTIVPILLVPQVVLSNGLVKLHGAAEWIARATMISFWGFDGIKHTLAAELLTAKHITGADLVPLQSTYLTDLIALGLFFLFFLLVAATGLKLKDRLG